MRTLTTSRAHRTHQLRQMLGVVVLGGALVAVTAGVAAAAPPPSVGTGPVSKATATSAVVSGAVDPHGEATTWYVEYGTSSAYGLKSAVQSAGDGVAGVSVSVTLTKLTQQTTYHYAIVATNAAGTVVGADGILTTLVAPIATTGVTTALTATSLTLTGVIEPNGQATSYFFEFGPTTAYGTRTTSRSAGSGSSALAVSVVVPNLMPKTLYHYRLVSESAAGVAYGHDATATTASDISLSAASAILTYGSTESISGTVANGLSGETVGILAEPAGATAFTGIGTTTSGAGGAWSFAVRPLLRTSYEVGVAGGNSPAIAISVRPAVSIAVTSGGVISTKITAGISFSGHVAQVQRLVNGAWMLVRHFALGAGGRANVSTSVLPSGTSTVRIAIGTNVVGPDQAAPGYLAGISRSVVVR